MQTFDRYRLDSANRRRVGGPAAHLITVEWMRSCSVDVDALHVPASDTLLISRGSLADHDPFGADDASTKNAIASWGVSWARYGRHERLGANLPLDRVSWRVGEFLTSDE